MSKKAQTTDTTAENGVDVPEIDVLDDNYGKPAIPDGNGEETEKAEPAAADEYEGDSIQPMPPICLDRPPLVRFAALMGKINANRVQVIVRPDSVVLSTTNGTIDALAEVKVLPPAKELPRRIAAVPAATFASAVASIGSERLFLHILPKRVAIAATDNLSNPAVARVNLDIIERGNAGLIAPIDQRSREGVRFAAADLADAAKFVLPVVARTSSQIAMTGIEFSIAAGGAILDATDGSALARATVMSNEKQEKEKGFCAVVPVKAIHEILPFCSVFENIWLSANGVSATFNFGGSLVIRSRLLIGKFPDSRKITPILEEPGIKLRIDGVALDDALRVISANVQEGRITVAPCAVDCLQLAAEDGGKTYASAAVPVGEGDPLPADFSRRYNFHYLQVLNSGMGGEEDGKEGVVFFPDGGKSNMLCYSGAGRQLFIAGMIGDQASRR